MTVSNLAVEPVAVFDPCHLRFKKQRANEESNREKDPRYEPLPEPVRRQ